VRKFHEQILSLSRSLALTKSLESVETGSVEEESIGLVGSIVEEEEEAEDEDEYDRSKHKKANRC
jgi:hypothetical protein